MSKAAIFTVAQLNAEVRQVLERGFGSIWLVGEISNFAAPGSGHWYFTLKDERAQVKGAMFRNANQRAKVRPQSGMQVLVRAKITLYEPRGDYQLIVEHMEDAGAGLLQQRYEQLKHKLQAQGLFAAEHKQPLPTEIRRVGVITSPTGAAIRDVLAVLQRRDPSVEVIIYPSAVQGQKAVDDLLFALQRACARNEVDVLLLTRGGGSLEDLWCFNDEHLAHALHSCPLPVISAVGHEVDFTIADYVADVRAPTPSAAAELVSRDQREVLQRLRQLDHRLIQHWQRQRSFLQQTLQHWHNRLQQQHPQRRLQQNSQRVDELYARASAALQRTQRQTQQRLTQSHQRLQSVHPQRQLVPLAQQLEQLQKRNSQAIRQTLKIWQQRQASTLQNLQIVSPLQTIARGYAVVQNQQGELIRQPQQLGAGEAFSVKVAEGEFWATKQSEETAE
ncbi:Exodeoxyribonuclease 7 large subunit [Pseudidiomarina piscicola]|uniref:Exodeoxyribonuclease 7 large subunit n=1 Tax=Pseudidiomarina piscicola TaxID=2614830 RepID=A0A6S6WNA6_9GAMM|nr:exodeoxyribonuclease VII large subunit [Pseudidiomarina piscicola]CAB0151562.1 Exodeoxyribonuclease 7 large subunit [Pseudidiomarina piscicola]VZT41027.1 Exodeoxyribonuclease 7 large subunit [Pseudomonas aeruginosa]